jgi:N6-adenosine-specific RNA methylase IME4/predicted XRE-type DNA-binding protein
MSLLDEIHCILGPLAKDDFDRLKSSIAKDGILLPVVVQKSTGAIIDGKHRSQVSQDFETRELDVDNKEAARLAVALNLARRHLTPEQKRELTLLLRRAEFTQAEVAEMMGEGQSTISERESISNIGADNIYSFDLRLRIPPQAKKAIAERVESGETQVQVAADFGITQPRVSQITRQVQARRNKPKPATTPQLPTSKYRCLVIDPPWPITKIEREVRPDQGIELDYPTMSLEEIAAWPINDWCDSTGCHIYLWVTHRFLPDAFDILRAWEVKYQCLLTWVKNVGFTPFSWMYSTEHVLFGRIGSLSLSQNGLRLDFSAKVQRHSRKPNEFYELVRQASPAPRLNVFSRETRDGFDSWGNETNDVHN